MKRRTVFSKKRCATVYYLRLKSCLSLFENRIFFNRIIITGGGREGIWKYHDGMINLVTGFLELLVQLPSFHPKRDAKQRNKRY